MKTVGLIGGIGPESTIEYYRFLIDAYRSRVGGDSYPSIVINSVNLTKLVRHFEAGELDAVTEYLALEVGRLEKAGADFAALTANTPHIVFDRVRARVSIPMVSIVEATCEAAVALRCRRVGLLGTRFTMQAQFFPEVFSRRGVELVVPDADEQEYIHEKYMGELLQGKFLPETREGLLRVARRLRDRHKIDGLILGGTELPLLLREAPIAGVPVLDTTKIHVDRIVTELVS